MKCRKASNPLVAAGHNSEFMLLAPRTEVRILAASNHRKGGPIHAHASRTSLGLYPVRETLCLPADRIVTKESLNESLRHFAPPFQSLGRRRLSLPHPTWTLPGGKYVRRRIPNWEDNIHLIGMTCETLSGRSDFDPSRPYIEYYRSQGELLVMVPVR